MNHRSKSRLQQAPRTIGVLLLALIAAIPLYYILINSFKSQTEMFVSPLGLPPVWRLENFVAAFADGTMIRGFRNSLLLTLGGLILQVIIGSLAAFGMILAKIRLTTIIGTFLLFAFAVPVQVLLIPQFRMLGAIGLTDSLLGVVLLYATGAIFCYFLIVGYMRSLPRDMIEAARIDGASSLRIYWQIILPLCRPILTTVIVFQTLAIWNDFLIPQVYLLSPENRTVVLQVFSAVGMHTVNWPVFFATTVIALLPIVIFFIICQKWIVSGLLAGSVKG